MNKVFDKRNNGITLIALVITIIILLILAGISIVALTGENGLIFRTKLAKTEQEKAQVKEELQLKITELQLKIAGEESREATLDDFNNLITEDEELTFISASYNTASTEIVQGEFETIKVLYKDYIFTVDSSLEIIEVEENTNMAKVDLNYEVKEKQEIDGKVMYTTLIRFQSSEKITKVEYENQVLKSDVGIEEIAIDLEVEMGTEYIFKITTLSGKSINKSLNITSVPITAIVLEKTEIEMKVLDSYVINYSVEPDFAEETNLIWTSSNEEIVTVNSKGVIKAKAEGEYKLTPINSYHSYAYDYQVGINDKGKSLTFVGENEKTKLIYYGGESTKSGANPFMCLNSTTIIRNMIIEFYPGKEYTTYNALFSHTYGNVYNTLFIVRDTSLNTCYGYNNRNYLNVNIKNCDFYFENTSLVQSSYYGYASSSYGMKFYNIVSNYLPKQYTSISSSVECDISENIVDTKNMKI